MIVVSPSSHVVSIQVKFRIEVKVYDLCKICMADIIRYPFKGVVWVCQDA